VFDASVTDLTRAPADITGNKLAVEEEQMRRGGAFSILAAHGESFDYFEAPHESSSHLNGIGRLRSAGLYRWMRSVSLNC
jgi:hypothetical protein